MHDSTQGAQFGVCQKFGLLYDEVPCSITEDFLCRAFIMAKSREKEENIASVQLHVCGVHLFHRKKEVIRQESLSLFE